jgi:hypothetical protein
MCLYSLSGNAYMFYFFLFLFCNAQGLAILLYCVITIGAWRTQWGRNVGSRGNIFLYRWQQLVYCGVSWCLLNDWFLVPCHFVDRSNNHASCISLMWPIALARTIKQEMCVSTQHRDALLIPVLIWLYSSLHHFFCFASLGQFMF